MEIKQLSGNAKPERASFKLHEGEIFGLAGLDGAGCRETLRTVFGLDQMRSGEAFVRGQRTNGFKTADLWENGVGMAGEGIMPGRSVADNFALAGIRDFSALGFVSSQRQGDVTIDWMQKLGVVARGPWQEIETLSTSNQRRIAIGRLLRHKARILLLDEPTRGVDTATRNFIYDMLIDLAAGGRAILLASSDFRELLGVCDTLGAMRHGRFIAIRPTAEWSKNELIDAIYGDEEPFQAPQPPTETP